MISRLWCIVRIDLLCCSNVVQAVCQNLLCEDRPAMLFKCCAGSGDIWDCAKVCFVKTCHVLMLCRQCFFLRLCQSPLCEDLPCCDVVQAVFFFLDCAKVRFVKTCHVVILYRQWWGTVSWRWVQHRGRESPVQPQQNSAGNIYKQLYILYFIFS